jgi:hypothetical protein
MFAAWITINPSYVYQFLGLMVIHFPFVIATILLGKKLGWGWPWQRQDP